MNGNILLGTIQVEALDVDTTDRIKGIEEWESYDGKYALPANDIYQELNFKVELSPGHEERIKYLDDLNGKSVLVSSKMFRTFRGRVASKRHNVPTGSELTVFEITVKEFEN